MSEDEAAELWAHVPNSPYKRLFEYELAVLKKQEEVKLLGDLTYEQYQKQKGVIEGITIAIGLLNRKSK